MQTPEEWIDAQGGTLCDDDMVIAWCHDDTRPSAKLYRDEPVRVRCFACHETHYLKSLTKAKPRVTIEQYREYKAKHGGWPTLQEVANENL